MRILRILFWTFLCLVVQVGEVQALTQEQLARLVAGDALVGAVESEASGGAVRVSLLIWAPVERIWDVLLSCERSFEYVDGLRRCEFEVEGLEFARVRQTVKKHVLLPTLDYLIEFNRVPFESIRFQRVSGDLKALEGHWTFRALEDEEAVLVTHEIRVQPSFPVPRWLVRRNMARGVPDMLYCLRAVVSGAPSAAREISDRDSCPSPASPG